MWHIEHDDNVRKMHTCTCANVIRYVIVMWSSCDVYMYSQAGPDSRGKTESQDAHGHHFCSECKISALAGNDDY